MRFGSFFIFFTAWWRVAARDGALFRVLAVLPRVESPRLEPKSAAHNLTFRFKIFFGFIRRDKALELRARQGPKSATGNPSARRRISARRTPFRHVSLGDMTIHHQGTNLAANPAARKVNHFDGKGNDLGLTALGSPCGHMERKAAYPI